MRPRPCKIGESRQFVCQRDISDHADFRYGDKTFDGGLYVVAGLCVSGQQAVVYSNGGWFAVPKNESSVMVCGGPSANEIEIYTDSNRGNIVASLEITNISQIDRDPLLFHSKCCLGLNSNIASAPKRSRTVVSRTAAALTVPGKGTLPTPDELIAHMAKRVPGDGGLPDDRRPHYYHCGVKSK